MTKEPPNWVVLKECAEELTHRGLTPFTRQQLITAVQSRFPDRSESSLNPMIQGMTINLKGGAPGGIGKEVFRSVGRGVFELRPQSARPHGAPDVSTTAREPARKQYSVVPSAPTPTNDLRPLILVSCVKSKRNQPAIAEDLYTSAWFVKAKRFAKAHGEQWFILSAKYGLVEPECVLEPYELTLNELRIAERREWAERVMQALRPRLVPGRHVILLAGSRYREFLMQHIEQHGCHVEAPLASIAGLGPQQN
ncbi:DUF6884 domain-containing protein [Deinococcus peraridilitoris]|uniref:HTH HARE-type domain-containing protein n=1 Tax=Deinococcus peraridilitoris (strain DSM 19664 / LMG 22246 / CIP 109416 / KR-200) TaxID=937777 RepID=L0A877_DEIPD|nr:DUF6884 domain-containing protein [Deinococcus peraridilitoris]AFZ69387.1 hypothetical protein Deipe_3986 [Deinococcus peraridilitoris DSM 19664]